MTFNSLPAELTLSVAEYLDPSSSLYFALTCKAHFKLCKKINEKHKRLFAENRVIDAWHSIYPYENHILWNKLKEILDNPIVGEYARELSLPSRRATYLDPHAAHGFQLTARSPRLPQEDVDRFAGAGQEIEDLYGPTNISLVPDGTAWTDFVAKGSSEPIIAMLFHHMPYLKTFRFTDLEVEAILLRVVRAAAVGYSDPLLAPKMPFQHLTTVAVAHWDTEMSVDPDWCLFFCAIPSVRNFVAHAMGGFLRPDTPVQRLPKSNVRELVFNYSRFSTQTLKEILRNTSCLEKFSYDVGGWTVSDDAVNPKENLNMLVEYAGSSLQHLVYEIDDDSHVRDDTEEDEGVEVNLRGFQQLKTLRIDWRILWPDEENLEFDDEEDPNGGFFEEGANPSANDFDIHSIFPASLEKLYLTGRFTSEDLERVSKIHSPSEFTPLLETIYIRDNATVYRDEDVPGITVNPLMKYLEGHGCD